MLDQSYLFGYYGNFRSNFFSYICLGPTFWFNSKSLQLWWMLIGGLERSVWSNRWVHRGVWVQQPFDLKLWWVIMHIHACWEEMVGEAFDEPFMKWRLIETYQFHLQVCMHENPIQQIMVFLTRRSFFTVINFN